MPKRQATNFPLQPGNRERAGTCGQRERETGNIRTQNTSVDEARASSNGYYRKVWKRASSPLSLLSFQIKSMSCPFICYVVLPRQRKKPFRYWFHVAIVSMEMGPIHQREKAKTRMINAFGSTFGFRFEDHSSSFSPGNWRHNSLWLTEPRVTVNTTFKAELEIFPFLHPHT